MWYRTGAIGAYGGIWYGDLRLLLRDGTPASGCDRPNDEPDVRVVEREHDVQRTLNAVADMKLEVRAQLWQFSGSEG